MSAHSIEGRLRLAGALVSAGLLVEIGVSAWVHPLAFVSFALVAWPLVGAGRLLFLWALIARS